MVFIGDLGIRLFEKIGQKEKRHSRVAFSFEKVFLLMGYSKKLYNVLGGYK